MLTVIEPCCHWKVCVLVAQYVLSSVGTLSQVNVLRKEKWKHLVLFCFCFCFSLYLKIEFNKFLSRLRIRKWLVAYQMSSFHFMAELIDTYWQVFDRYSVRGPAKNPKMV